MNEDAVNDASKKAQLPIVQVVFKRPASVTEQKAFEFIIDEALVENENNKVKFSNTKKIILINLLILMLV